MVLPVRSIPEGGHSQDEKLPEGPGPGWAFRGMEPLSLAVAILAGPVPVAPPGPAGDAEAVVDARG